MSSRHFGTSETKDVVKMSTSSSEDESAPWLPAIGGDGNRWLSYSQAEEHPRPQLQHEAVLQPVLQPGGMVDWNYHYSYREEPLEQFTFSSLYRIPMYRWNNSRFQEQGRFQS